MQLAAKRVSAVVSGDYYQAHFDSDDRDGKQVDPYGGPEPYVLIQRQFESFDGGKCYIESHNEEYIGHFKLQLLEFSAARLAYEISRRDHTLVEVTFALTSAEFEEARPIVEVIFEVREPGGDSQFVDQAFQAKLGHVTTTPRAPGGVLSVAICSCLYDCYLEIWMSDNSLLESYRSGPRLCD